MTKAAQGQRKSNGVDRNLRPGIPALKAWISERENIVCICPTKSINLPWFRTWSPPAPGFPRRNMIWKTPAPLTLSFPFCHSVSGVWVGGRNTGTSHVAIRYPDGIGCPLGLPSPQTNHVHVQSDHTLYLSAKVWDDGAVCAVRARLRFVQPVAEQRGLRVENRSAN